MKKKMKKTGAGILFILALASVWGCASENGGTAQDASGTADRSTGTVETVPEEKAQAPVIHEDGSVTFYFEIGADSLGEDVPCLMGTVPGTDWDAGLAMSDEDGNGIWTVTVESVAPGRYQYKYKYGSTWVTDPKNTATESGNSLVVVEGFLIECENPAGSGSFEVEAAISGDMDGDSVEWSVTDMEGGEPAGIRIEGDPSDRLKATLTVTDEAGTGYFNIIAHYTEDGKEAETVLKRYYTERAVLYEYAYREDSEHTGESDIYTWYNSRAGNTGAKFRERNGRYTAYVTLDDSTSDFGYIIRLPGMWGADESTDREFSDRTVYVNRDDRYTKVKGGEGIEVPCTLPSGKTDYQDGILFKWRDDALFYGNQMDDLKDAQVNVVIKKEGADTELTKAMAYSEEDELFTYHFSAAEGLEDADYRFYFTVNGEKREDVYRDGRIAYKKPVLEVTAAVSPETAGYNDNPVVSFDIKEKDTDKPVEVSAITADISGLCGGGKTVSFEPLAKEGVLYIDRGVAAGTYKVPVTVTDLYGNDTKAEIEVKVGEKEASDTAWDESVVYFLLTDRFCNGDTANDRDCAPDKPEAYHGGDFAGIISKLDYLKELGINTIWISPIVDNIDTIVNEELHQQAYHGYWAKDFTQIDEHLGDMEDLDRLLDEAAARGIRLMVDVVVNHAGYGTGKDENGEKGASYQEKFEGMLRDGAGVEGDVVLGSLDGLPDFQTEEAGVRAQLIEWQTAWANHATKKGNRIAAFRVDTVKHVDHNTWQDLKSSLAKANPEFKLIGEYYGAGISNTGGYLGNGQMDALLDFEFKSTARSFVDGHIESAETALEQRNAALTSSNTLGQFLGSHDEDGFLYRVGYNTAKMKAAAALQLTAKGIPVIYYGEEINLTGPNAFGKEGNNRYDMQFDDLSSVQLDMLGHYKKLLASRIKHAKVFAAGDREKVAGSTADGFLVFKRGMGGEQVYVGINTTGTAKEVTFHVVETGSLAEEYSGKSVPVTAGAVTVTIPANTDGGTVILAKEEE